MQKKLTLMVLSALVFSLSACDDDDAAPGNDESDAAATADATGDASSSDASTSDAADGSASDANTDDSSASDAESDATDAESDAAVDDGSVTDAEADGSTTDAAVECRNVYDCAHGLPDDVISEICSCEQGRCVYKDDPDEVAQYIAGVCSAFQQDCDSDCTEGSAENLCRFACKDLIQAATIKSLPNCGSKIENLNVKLYCDSGFVESTVKETWSATGLTGEFEMCYPGTRDIGVCIDSGTCSLLGSSIAVSTDSCNEGGCCILPPCETKLGMCVSRNAVRAMISAGASTGLTFIGDDCFDESDICVKLPFKARD